MTSAPTLDADLVYGVLTIGAAQVALPLAGLREVIPCPQQFIVLPSQATGLLGAVDLREQVIGVLDLRVVLGMAAERRPDQVIVIVVHDGQVLGLLADEVRGVTTIPVQALQAMTAVGEVELLFSHSFERPEDASVVSVLDVAAICRLPGTPLIRDSPLRAGTSGGTGTAGQGSTGQGRSMLLMRCGQIGLGIEIEHVHATLPHLDVRPSPLRHGVCLGVVDHGGALVPVIDPLQLMEMGVLPADRVQGLVLRFDAGLVVLLLTEVIEIVQVQVDEVLTLPPFTVRQPGYFRGVVQVAELGDFLVLSSEKLMESDVLQTLSTLNLANDAGQAGQANSADPAGASAAGRADGWAASGGAGAEAAGGLYLTYSVAGEVASPLEQILEILPYPEGFASLGDPDGLVLGLMTHREQVVPLVCLATLMGRPERPDPLLSCVLVVSSGTGPIGLVVRSLGAIERSVWEEPADPTDPAVQKRTIRTAPVGSAGSERMLTRIDLTELARALATRPDSGLSDIR